MDLTKKSAIKELLEKYDVKAEKKFGQHFILSKKALVQIIAAAEIKKNDTIIEIGPGLGTLTQELSKSGAKIIAIEKDPVMINILSETLADYKNIKIIHSDARQISMSDIDVGHRYKKYKIVANLPYNVATFLIHQWLESEKPPESMILMIQKEVAQRIIAKPPRMNLLAVSIQFYAEAKIVDYVPAEAFWPRPKVDSAIIKITPIKKRSQKTRNVFFMVAKAGFSQPRKQLASNLAKKLNIPKEKILEIFNNFPPKADQPMAENISERARAENLSLEQWVLLSTILHPTLQEK
ncbi:MAG: 16S rRNA (adenine(1518)-N(6)/adenine(1519)-N(6))-dimethyltransferase RsmA [Patescibacteria group bacterium]